MDFVCNVYRINENSSSDCLIADHDQRANSAPLPSIPILKLPSGDDVAILIEEQTQHSILIENDHITTQEEKSVAATEDPC